MAETKTYEQEYGGEKWQVTPENDEIRARFERWLKHAALLEVEETRDLCTPEQYAARHKECVALVASKYFRFGNPGYDTASASLEGVVMKTWLMLLPKHPELTVKKVAGWFSKDLDEYVVGQMDAAQKRVAEIRELQAKKEAEARALAEKEAAEKAATEKVAVPPATDAAA